MSVQTGRPVAVPAQARSSREAVAAELRAEMARQRISGVKLAQRLQWETKYLNRRLNGLVPFSIDDLDALCRELGIGELAFAPADGLEPSTCRCTTPGRQGTPVAA